MSEFTKEEIAGILKTLHTRPTREKKVPLRLPPPNNFDLKVAIEVLYGTKTLSLNDLLNIKEGDVLKLDQENTTSLEILANGKKIALGEIVEIDGHFGVKVLEFEE